MLNDILRFLVPRFLTHGLAFDLGGGAPAR